MGNGRTWTAETALKSLTDAGAWMVNDPLTGGPALELPGVRRDKRGRLVNGAKLTLRLSSAVDFLRTKYDARMRDGRLTALGHLIGAWNNSNQRRELA